MLVGSFWINSIVESNTWGRKIFIIEKYKWN